VNGPEDDRFFLYDGGNVVCEMDKDGTVLATNIFAADGLFARKTGDNSFYYQFDPQGNVVAVLSKSSIGGSSPTVCFAYNAWGSRNYAYPSSAADLEQPFSYNGKWGYYYDARVNLYYCQNRFYSPDAGRWINRDPIGFAGGMNVYGYCGSGPVGAMDPSGLFTSSTLMDINAMTDECWDLANVIMDVVHELNIRFIDLVEDRHYLFLAPSAKWDDSPGTWNGHIEQYNNKIKFLKRLLTEWYELCEEFVTADVCAHAITVSDRRAPSRPDWTGDPYWMPTENYSTLDGLLTGISGLGIAGKIMGGTTKSGGNSRPPLKVYPGGKTDLPMAAGY
jgi:RHS repeat-associated protein